MGIIIGLDVLFIHPPRNFKHLRLNLKRRSSYMIFPMGLLGLADLIEREGYSARILNYPLEMILNSYFSLTSYLNKANPCIVGVDLHWIQHSAGAIELLQFVKKHFPNTFTLLGGYSATFYAKEIMQSYEFIDGIIQGEAEQPILQLIKHQDSLNLVPNLIYRDNGQVKDNKITYIAREIDSLNFTKLNLLDHWREYLELCDKKMRSSFPLELARGCPFNCIYCGGSHFSNKKLLNRDSVTFRSPRRVVDDIKEMTRITQLDRIHFGYGVYPATEKYFMEIQRIIREEKIDVSAELEVWRLPVSKKFLRDFAATYRKKHSVICLSPRNFSSSYRQKFHKGLGNFDNSFDFSEIQFRDFLKHMAATGMQTVLFYDVGYPYETYFDIIRNILIALKINLQNFGQKRRIGLLIEPIIMAPGSPAVMLADQMGLKIYTKSFKDYVDFNLHTPMNATPWDIGINYRTSALSSCWLNFFIRLTFLANILSFIPFLIY